MGTTPNYALPWPEETAAPPDVSADVHGLATATDTAIAGVAATVKPLDTAGTNISSSAPADTKLAGTSGKAADAGHRHAREAADAIAATASPRTLGTGAQQAAPGNHTHGGVTDAQITAAFAAWTAWTPAAFTGVTSATGVFRYKAIGKTLHFQASFNGGMASGTLTFTLPGLAQAVATGVSQGVMAEDLNLGTAVNAFVPSNGTTVSVAMPGGRPTTNLLVSGTIEVQ